jgi:hypothetical protein
MAFGQLDITLGAILLVSSYLVIMMRHHHCGEGIDAFNGLCIIAIFLTTTWKAFCRN